MKKYIYALLAVLAFNLGMFGWSFWLSESAEARHPMHGERVAAYDTQLHVVDSHRTQTMDIEHRSDYTIVLLHGAGTSLLDFSSSLYPALSAEYRTISIDRPGHGYSERGDVDELRALTGLASANNPQHHDWMSPDLQARLIADALVSLNVQNAVLVGHSWAGSVLLAALLQAHEHIRAGVLIAGVSHAWNDSRAMHIKLATRPVIGPVFRWQYIAPIGSALLEKTVVSAFSPEPVPENYLESTGLALSIRPATYRHNAEDLIGLSAFLQMQQTRYHLITAPVMSIVGSEDHVVPMHRHHKKLAQQIPHLQTVVMEGAGHLPHHTRTDETVSAIRAFIDNLDGGSTL